MYVKYSFSDSEITEVKQALKKEKNAAKLERLQAVFMTMQGLKREEVAFRLNRGRDFVKTWLKKYKTLGLDGLNERRGGAHHQYLTPEQEAFIKDIVLHAHPADCNYSEVTWSGWLLVDLIKNMYSKEYTREGVYALLKRMGVSYKKANKIDPKKSQKVINEWKQQIQKNSKI